MAGFDDHSYGAGPRVIRGQGHYAGQGVRQGQAPDRHGHYDDDAYGDPYPARRIPVAPQPAAYAEPAWEPEYEYQPEYRHAGYPQAEARVPRPAAPLPRDGEYTARPFAQSAYSAPHTHDMPAMSPFARLTQLAGAASSVAILIGVVVWGYGIAVRDVSGIPVIRAAEGPMRVAPVDPGGQIADHVGMAVNALPAEKAAEALPEEIALAPPPVALAPEDGAGLSAGFETPVEQIPAADPVPEPVTLPETVTMAEPAADPVALALEAALADGPEVAVTQGLTRSPRPMRRPGGVSGAVVAGGSGAGEGVAYASEQMAAGADPMIPVVGEVPERIDPATLTAGTPLVQLGAFDDTAQAEQEWGRLTGRFGDLFSGKAMVVQTATSGGRNFYRLRAYGFADQDEQRRFCAALLAENAACIPVAHR